MHEWLISPHLLGFDISHLGPREGYYYYWGFVYARMKESHPALTAMQWSI